MRLRYRVETATEHGKKAKHGMHNTRLYRIWRGIKQRCTNPNYHSYADYGGRGITVCDEWLEFEPFRDWALANGYRDDFTIDRIDSNGSYTPENSRWASMRTQQNNKRNNRKLTYNGITRTVPEWARITNIPVTAIYKRMKHNWPAERILTEKIRTYTRRNKKWQ